MATVDSPFSPAPAQPKKPSLGSISLSAPVLNRPANSPVRAEEGVSFETASQAGLGEGLAAGFVSSSKQPVAPAAPLPVGGDVKSARLISSTAPVYPTIARAQRISGDVKIDALVEANGVVSSMKVVAGPPLLQQSAMEAVRHWRYQPAQLDGKAVPMHLTVTVQFKLQ
jgi:TonB family protein